MKSMSRVKQLINVPINEIKAAYEEVFSKRNNFKLNDIEINSELDSFLKSHEANNNKNLITITANSFKEIVKSLKNGKSAGISMVNNEMIKYCD